MIDLREYTPDRRKYLFSSTAACVYVICPDLRKPCKVGSSIDIVQTHQKLQQAVWFIVHIGFILWTPGKAIARRIESMAHAEFDKSRLSGEWFDLEIDEVGKKIGDLAKELYPTASYMSHEQMVEYLKRKVLRRPTARPRNLEFEEMHPDGD